MSNFPLTSGQGIVRFSLVWILGLGMLLAPLADSLALPPGYDPAETYCLCTCRSSEAWRDLSWVKKAHCLLNGRSCSIKVGETTQAGKLESCSECNVTALGGLFCLPAAANNIHVDDVLGCTVKSPHLLRRGFPIDKR
jgi:hypothetical protein